MLEKLKNWIIKKLGGYTEGEYQSAKSFGEPLPLNPLRVERQQPVTLQVRYSYPDDAIDRMEALRRAEARVKLGLNDATLRYMTLRATKEDVSRTITVEGTLRVLEKEAEDGKNQTV